tara:strand:- start:93 stop:380 length:288 start_codon:yes stop_codon:yes gene_type:complete
VPRLFAYGPPRCSTLSSPQYATACAAIDDELWLRLDEFETDFYTHERVAVETKSGSIETQTCVVAARHYKYLEHRPWSPQAFATHSLEQNLRKYA